MNNSYHRPESLSMLHHNPMYEHNSTFTSSNQASNHNSIPSRIVTSQHRHDYHDTLLEKIASTQKTMEQLAISNQNLMQRQSEMLMRIFEDQAASAATQTNLLHKQTLILQTMHAPVTKRVPASHFMPNPSDGISLDASSNQPSLAQTDQQDDDDAQSVHSTASVVIHNPKPDKKLKIRNFQTEWIQDSHNCQLWFQSIISELAANEYYDVLLTANKKEINYISPPTAPNASLYSQLCDRLDTNFLHMMQNSGFKTGTDLLGAIDSAIRNQKLNKKLTGNARSEFYSCKWNPKTQTVLQFNQHFNELLQALLNEVPDHSFTDIKFVWIKAMPAHFKTLRSKFNNGNLDDRWTDAINVYQLYLATITEMGNEGITITPGTKPPKEKQPPPTIPPIDKKQHPPKPPPRIPIEPIALTVQNLHNVKAHERGHFPFAHPSSIAIETNVREMKAAGKTLKDAETKFTEGYIFPSCWLCRVKPPNAQGLFHKAADCPLLQDIFKPYNTVPFTSPTSPSQPSTWIPVQSRRTKTSPQDISPAEPLTMCYDSGTLPYSLSDRKELFNNIVYFDKPQYVALADEDTLVRALGRGLLDIVAEGHRFQMTGILTETTPVALLSAADHLRYINCKIIGEQNKLHIHFPTFSITTHGSTGFEFPITAGKEINLPIEWTPLSTDLCDIIHLPSPSSTNNIVHIKPMTPDCIIPYRATTDSTGYDVATPVPCSIPSHSIVRVPLGFAMSFPNNIQCQLRPRSSLSSKGINISFGTIDPDYRGQVQAIVHNTTANPFDFHLGHRIGQLVFAPIVHPQLHSVQDLETSIRDTGGFGSTGTTSKRVKKKTRKSAYRRGSTFSPTLGSLTEPFSEDMPSELVPSPSKSPFVTKLHIPTSTPTPHPTATVADTSINTISHSTLDLIINTTTETDVHDVPQPIIEKQVFDDAITLFPLDLYRKNELSIIGSPDDTSTSTASTEPESSDDSSISSSESDESDTESTPAVPSVTNPTPTDIPTDDPSIECTASHPTDIIHEHLVHDYLYDDNNMPAPAPITSPSPAPSIPTTHQPFQSILFTPENRIPPEDRTSSTEPAQKIMTTEYLQKCIGFRNIQPILKYMKEQAQDTVIIRDSGTDPILSRGEAATLPKKRRNTSEVEKPHAYGKIFHYDIVYGNGRAIGGINYALLFVDRKSRRKFLFGLQDLESPSIQRALKKFIRKLGHYPDEIIADRDFRIIGEHVDDLLEPHTQVSGAPSGRQSQNGLCEINWRYICNIARNYLAENLLPSQFWYFAVRYAVQASNYIPIKTDKKGTLSTPFFLAHNVKPDYRKLLPLFSSAYVKICKAGESNTFETQTVRAILVGNDDKSDGRLFYNPTTKSMMASSDYRLDTSRPSGPLFNLEYTQPTSFSFYNDTVEDTPPTYDINQKVYIIGGWGVFDCIIIE